MKSRNIILIGLALVVVAGLIFANLPTPQPEAPAASAPPAQPSTPSQSAQASQPAPAAAEPHADHAPGADTTRVPHFHETLADAGKLPKVLPASHFYIPVVQQAYTAAAKIPKVLALQPCYCWCDKIGHGSLLDCFATEHGAGWAVCVKEVLLADQMTKQGKSPQQIREAIIRGDWERVPLD